MKQWLFYTKSDGSVSSRPHYPELDTADKKRADIGDPGAKNFRVFDHGETPRHAVWDGSTYITNEAPPWQRQRDLLINSAVIIYSGKLIDMSPSSRVNFAQVKDSIGRRDKAVLWKVKDQATGAMERLSIKLADIEKFEDTVVDAIENLHIQADAGDPVNPWPLEVS